MATGAICQARIDNTNIRECTRLPGCIIINGAKSLLCHGDSGGPVFSLTDNETAGVARGLVHSSYGTVVNCPDPLFGHFGFTSPTRVCSTGVTFSELSNVLDLNKKLITE